MTKDETIAHLIGVHANGHSLRHVLEAAYKCGYEAVPKVLPYPVVSVHTTRETDLDHLGRLPVEYKIGLADGTELKGTIR